MLPNDNGQLPAAQQANFIQRPFEIASEFRASQRSNWVMIQERRSGGRGTLHTRAALVEHVGVGHGRADISVAEKLSRRANILAGTSLQSLGSPSGKGALDWSVTGADSAGA